MNDVSGTPAQAVTTEQHQQAEARLQELFGQTGFRLLSENGGVKLVLSKHRAPKLPEVLGCPLGTLKNPTPVRNMHVADTGEVFHIFTRVPENMLNALSEAVNGNRLQP